jgi:hypothetical protein
MIWLLSVVVGLLAGCGGSPPSARPSATPTGASPTRPAAPVTTSAANPTATRTGPLTTGPNVRPGEKPPVLPDIAKRHDRVGALSFADYFVLALDWAYATNDEALLLPISASTCNACDRLISRLRELHAKNRTLTGARIRSTQASISSTGPQPPAEFSVVEHLVQQAGTVVGAKLQIVQRIAALASDSTVEVGWELGRWKVFELSAAS